VYNKLGNNVKREGLNNMKRTYIFNFKLKELLERRGMTQKELSALTGIREATISEMVNDSRSVYNKVNLSKVMDALNVLELSDILELIVTEK
jgi:transcriptional regulator with XRE-family HTH domain